MWASPAQRDETQAKDDQELSKVIADPLLRPWASPMPTREELVAAKLDPDAYVGHDRDWYDGVDPRPWTRRWAGSSSALRGLGLDGAPCSCFTADHGEEFLEHGRTFHGQSVYGELNNVPARFWGPGSVPAGRVVDETVQTIDVMPTLLEMSGLPVPDAAQGHSLLPLLVRRAAPGSAARARAAGRTVRPSPRRLETEDERRPAPARHRVLRPIVGGWKLIHNTKRPGGHAGVRALRPRARPARPARTSRPRIPTWWRA